MSKETKADEWARRIQNVAGLGFYDPANTFIAKDIALLGKPEEDCGNYRQRFKIGGIEWPNDIVIEALDSGRIPSIKARQEDALDEVAMSYQDLDLIAEYSESVKGPTS